MGEQIQRTAERSDESVQQETNLPVVETSVDMDDIDALLAEIDSVLEENPEAFVAAYQQRGGQ